MSSNPNRRALIQSAMALPAIAAAAPHVSDPLSGERLYADVQTYSSFGSHRTSGPGDAATSTWLSDRFDRLGFEVKTPSFPFALFEPSHSALIVEGRTIPVFPTWPPCPTPSNGIKGALSATSSPSVLAIVPLSYQPGGSLDVPATGAALDAAVKAGASAVIGVTEGPTGSIIAQNAVPARFAWPIPVVLAAGEEKAALLGAAARGASATLYSTGALKSDASATNIIARRRGRGRTIALSTPKSGWFSCAGERGSGIALFLAMAERLSARPDLDLLFLSTSGHEIQGLGGHRFMDEAAPPPDHVRLWVHLGANLACDALDVSTGHPLRSGRPTRQRGILASPELLPLARAAFLGQPGYETPRDVDATDAVGEVLVYRKAGFRPLIGMVGAAPLHHTPLDQPELATSPALLEPVARSLDQMIQSAIVAE